MGTENGSLTSAASPTNNHDAEIISIVAVFLTFSLITILLRLMSRRFKHVKLYYDDYLAIAAWVLAVAEGAMLASATQYAGLGQHESTLTTKQVMTSAKAFFAFAIIHSTALVLGKLSVLVLLDRIFITRSFRLTVRILGTIVIAWWLSSILGYLCVCIPISANWDPSVHGHCGNEYIFTLVMPIPWVLTDFAILIAPIPVVRSLQLPRSEKIGICALFLTGGLTCVVASYRYSTLYFIKSDTSWHLVGVGNWSIIETNVTIMCACLITVKPALKYLLPEKIISSTQSTWLRLRSRPSKSILTQQEPYTKPTYLGSFERLNGHPRNQPLINESADRFGPRKLDEPFNIPLHKVYSGKGSSSWEGV